MIKHDLDDVERAMAIAYKAHRGQVDKQGMPYIFHCFAVASKFQTSDEQIVGLLHDLFEDTTYTLYDLEWQFSIDVCLALSAISKLPNEPYTDYIERVAHNPLATKV